MIFSSTVKLHNEVSIQLNEAIKSDVIFKSCNSFCVVCIYVMQLTGAGLVHN